MTLYGDAFYKGQQERSDNSARVVVPFLVEHLAPRSVLDVGCGAGRWCAEFDRCGVSAYGLDGPWAQSRFPLDQSRFSSLDFQTAAMPFSAQTPLEKFDLVTTFEFLEHVSPERAAAIVDFLTSKADVVVAGAATPGQGGTGHVNEQWPRYWRELFEARGFEAYDFIRPALWEARGVEPWYLQNPIGYFRNGVPDHVRAVGEAQALARLRDPAPLIHPGLYALANDPTHRSIRSHAAGLLKAVQRKVGLQSATPK